MKTAYLSIGSNLGDRQKYLSQALELLEMAGVRIARKSPVFETEPQDLQRQPWFLNIVAEVETSLFPIQLLSAAQRIERALGRKRTVPKGPRSVDIDILLYGNFVVNTSRLTIPHPRLAERRFVLAPLAELAPELRHPVTRKTVREMLAGISGQIVRRVE